MHLACSVNVMHLAAVALVTAVPIKRAAVISSSLKDLKHCDTDCQCVGRYMSEVVGSNLEARVEAQHQRGQTSSAADVESTASVRGSISNKASCNNLSVC